MSLRVAAAAGVLLVCAACGSKSPSTPTPVPVNVPVSIVPSAASQGSNAYNPNPVAIKVGDSLTWTNNDTRNHTMTENTGAWNSGNIAPGQTYTLAFTTKGTFTYHCNLHSGMSGTVNVQ